MNLYFIGYALSAEEAKPVDELRNRIAAQFDVHAALKIVPHITIVRPFETEQEAELIAGMRKMVANEKTFVVPLPKFVEFAKSKVWAIDVEPTKELVMLKDWLRLLAMGVWKREQISAESESRFHVTLSYRDVKPETHAKIGALLKKEPLPLESLNVGAISLFKHRGTGEGWEVVETFQFGS